MTLKRGRDGLTRQYLATLYGVTLGVRHIIDIVQQAVMYRGFLCNGVTRNPLWLRGYANAAARTPNLTAEEDAVTLGAVIAAEAEKKSFFSAKYRVFLQMHDD